MAGYIGAKVGTVTGNAADIKGDISSTDTSPDLTLKNTTQEDSDGGRESTITFKGEQTGGEESTLAEIRASHDGTADDQAGLLSFKTNDGSDGTSPTTALVIDSAQNVGIGTNSPDTPAGNKSLHIAGTTGAELILERDDSGVVTDDFIGGLAFLNSDGSNTPPHYLGITATATNAFGASQLEFFSSFEQYPSGTSTMVLDSPGNVGIGRTTLTEKFEVNGSINSSNQSTNFTTGNYRMNMDIVDSLKLGRIGTIDGASTPSGTEGQVQFLVNAAEKMRLTSDGLTFNGDTAAGNALDDYEEGNWSPTYTLSSSPPDSVSYHSAVNGGFYKKIGSFVHISGVLYTTSITIGSGSGTLRIGGLPFAVGGMSAGQSRYSSVYIGETTAFTGEHPISGRFVPSATLIDLFYRSSVTGDSQTNTGADLNTGVNKNLLRFSGVYTTT